MKPVSFEVDGQKLTGTLFYPEQIKTKNPAILFLHGWKSSQKRMIPRAQQLAKLGFICLSFNLRGHGDSEGDRKILSRKDYVDDVIAAYDFLVQQAHVDKERMGIICTSFGAYLGSILTSKRKVKWLVLHAPAGYPDEGFTDPKPEDSSWTITWRNEKHVPEENKALDAIYKSNSEVYLIQSENDEWTPQQTIEDYKNAVKDKSNLTYIVLENADHSMKNGDSEERYLQLLLNWFSEKV